jgi:hypothetical protein
VRKSARRETHGRPCGTVGRPAATMRETGRNDAGDRPQPRFVRMTTSAASLATWMTTAPEGSKRRKPRCAGPGVRRPGAAGKENGPRRGDTTSDEGPIWREARRNGAAGRSNCDDRGVNGDVHEHRCSGPEAGSWSTAPLKTAGRGTGRHGVRDRSRRNGSGATGFGATRRHRAGWKEWRRA